jgi:hypothetical protein
MTSAADHPRVAAAAAFQSVIRPLASMPMNASPAVSSTERQRVRWARLRSNRTIATRQTSAKPPSAHHCARHMDEETWSYSTLVGATKISCQGALLIGTVVKYRSSGPDPMKPVPDGVVPRARETAGSRSPRSRPTIFTSPPAETTALPESTTYAWYSLSEVALLRNE